MARNSSARKDYRSRQYRFVVQHFGANRRERRAAKKSGHDIPAQNAPYEKDRYAPQLAPDEET
jgi:hypothetical protein